ncbi:transporter substrate-binding domain-containing protein [Chryseolinea sp. Jin1]|uniref:Transporter substrate-binding domain-containing protein n=1 Tax=Chryseolinea lacunae TaxID=2801331 RepID=A0ABS1KVL7_9BACT|nr:transporter substrate-binding domain-containing protein [Chryseolinea lacunae]
MVGARRFFLSALLLFAVCSSCHEQQKRDFFSGPEVNIDLDAIRKRGYINALVDNNSISYFIYKGHPMGYEYELLQLLAKHLNVTLKIKVTSGVEPAIQQLNKGEGDIIAFPLTINKARRKQVTFTRPHFNTYQVLVQRKPSNWKRLMLNQLEENMIRNPADLIGKEVHVIKGTSYEIRLKNLSEELGGDIIIKEDTITAESESLIRKVALGEIDYTVADHTMARVNSAYYPNLDVNTVLSVPQQIAWAVRSNSPELVKEIDTWLGKIKADATFMVIYNRYFKSPRTSLVRMNSDYSSFGGNKLSPYDEMIKVGAESLGWDWRLLASVVYQESKFTLHSESWAGAKGLMQLMPATAKRFGAKDLSDPQQSIHAGVNYLKYLDKYWMKSVSDPAERLKFVLASYNAGLAHIIDARKLCRKYKKDPNVWDENVEYFLLKKSEPKYYRDPVTNAGYCKCEEPVNYVKDVLDRFEQYKYHIKLPAFDEQAVENLKTAR